MACSTQPILRSDDGYAEAVLLTEALGRSLIMSGPRGKQFSMERTILNRREFWHKFTIINGSKYYKAFILKLIIEFVHPNDFIPVLYQKDNDDTFFLARNCAPAVEKLCRVAFVIPNPHGEDVLLRIVLNAVPLSEIPYTIQDQALLTVLKKRFNANTKHLNLKDLHNESELADKVFLPLSQPKILDYVIAFIKTGSAMLAESISLANNELCLLRSLEGLANFKHLRSLNLGYNKIPSKDELLVLKDLPLTDLILDNNPLCQEFADEESYTKQITEILPSLKTLDGFMLGSPGVPLSRRNFLVSPDGGPMVDQFLQHYFTLYDGSDRRKLLGIYHPQAIFSMTAIYQPGQSTSANARLTEYIVHSRNLVKLSDYSKTHRLLNQGADSVIHQLCRLPKTQHDPHTFTVDLALYSSKAACLMVCGVFREPNSLVRSFMRTFLLACVAANEWQITNEMFHMANARTEEAEQAFRIPREPVAQPNVTVLNRADREQMTEILAQLTDMNSNWASKCLEDMKWDFKDALTAFTDFYKMGKIPIEAFTR